ncbi:lipoyl synthase [Bacteroidota bacterium]
MSSIKKISKPDWLKINLATGEKYSQVKKTVSEHNLHTICSSGKCPNLAECWGKGTATFMILGEICTRSCKFCATKTGKPLIFDPEEPKKIANSVKILNLNHCVITSVVRDDLPDGGAAHWAETIQYIKKENPETTIEVLIPDFNGDKSCINQIIASKPDIISHNLETVKRITAKIRSKAKYELSLKVVKIISESNTISKSGIMVGLGETDTEVYQTMDDLKKVGCQIITIGQYLQPTKAHWQIDRYVHPDTFKKYKEYALSIGFKKADCAPLVRSSYHAEKHVL